MAPANPQEVHDIAKSAKSAKAIAAADPDKNTVNLPHFRDGLTPLARCIVFNLSEGSADSEDAGAHAVGRALMKAGAVADFPCNDTGVRLDMGHVHNCALGTLDLMRARRNLPTREDKEKEKKKMEGKGSVKGKNDPKSRRMALDEAVFAMADQMMGRTINVFPQLMHPISGEIAVPPQVLTRMRLENPEFDILFISTGWASRLPSTYIYAEGQAPPENMLGEPAPRCNKIRPVHILCACDSSPMLSLTLGLAGEGLEKGEDPTAIAFAGPRPGCKVATADFDKWLDVLLHDGKVDLNRIGGCRQPLHILASWSQNAKNVTALLKRGANPHARDAGGFTALHLACARWDRRHAADIVKALIAGLETSTDPNADKWSANDPVATSPDGSRVVGWGGTGVNAREMGGYGRTPLMLAVGGIVDADLSVVKALIAAGADVNAETLPVEIEVGQVNEQKQVMLGKHRYAPRTALHYALMARQRIEIIEALLEAGADPNGTVIDYGNKDDDILPSPLTLSLSHPPAVTMLLLKHGASVASDKESGKVLFIAARSGYVDNHRCKFLVETKESGEPVFDDVKDGDEDEDEVGVGIGADDDDTDGSVGGGATRRAAAKVIRLLIEAGADPDEKDEHGFAPAHIAAGTGNLLTMRALIAAGANGELASLPDSSGPTPHEIVAQAAAAGGVTVADSGAGGGGGCCDHSHGDHGHSHGGKSGPPPTEAEQDTALKSLNLGASAPNAVEPSWAEKIMEGESRVLVFAVGVLVILLALYLK